MVTARALVTCAALSGLAPVPACSEGPACAEVTTECQPLYEPTFENVFSRTLAPTCAPPGPCHDARSARGGLVYADPDDAHALLLGEGGGRARVLPGDPGCSLLVRRIASEDPRFRMPPGDRPLSAAERCAILQWIANGAAR